MTEVLNNWLVIYVLASVGVYYNWMILQDIKYDIKVYYEARSWAKFADTLETKSAEIKTAEVVKNG